MLNRIARHATRTALTIAVHYESTEDQSAPPIARNVHGSHRRALSNGPSSQLPAFASESDEPVRTIPSTKTTSPMASTVGITSGRFTTRTAISRISPNTNAGVQHRSEYSRIRLWAVWTVGWMFDAT